MSSLKREITNLDDYSTVLKELQTREYRSYFNHQFTHIPESEGLSSLWFKQTSTANASTGRSGPDAHVHLDASTDETASIETNEHGHYSPGSTAIAGLAIRSGSDITGDQDFWAGYTNGTNGVGIGEDGTGLYVFKDDEGTRNKVRQSDWNVDTLDGSSSSSNKSGLQLTDLQDGHIVRIPFLCYNQGQIEIKIGIKKSNHIEFVVVHRFVEIGGPSLGELNLPIKIKVENNNTAETLDAYLSALHFERLTGEADHRVNSEPRMGQSVDTSWTPLISVRQRTGWEGVNTRPLGLNLVSDTDAVIALLLGTDLGANASFGLPELTSSSETALEVDTSATSFDDTGEKRWGNFVKGGGGAQKFSQITADVNFNIPADQNLTLAARCVGSSGVIDSNITWQSEF